MNKEQELRNLLKQVEEKKSLRNQHIEKEKGLTREIEELLKKAEKISEELKEKINGK
jgi:hypothetical protein